MLAFLSWWAVIQVFGLAALPLVRRIFARLPDQGYAFSKTAGLLMVSYFLWFGASAGLLLNHPGGILLALLITAGLSAWAGHSSNKVPLSLRLRGYWQAQRAQIITVELLFLLCFAGWALVRAYSPEKILPANGEKYMEIAFLNGVLNSPSFPPLDPWLSGYGISYYYFGYVMMAVMVQAGGTSAAVGFDLYDALLFALTALSAYGVVSNMVRSSGGSRRAGRAYGLLGALFTTGLGNLQGLLEGLYASRALPAAFFTWLNIPGLAGSPQSGSFYPGHGWWWWRASRVLQDLDLAYQPVPYPPIDEFPFFSFLLGDNHPHKMALPFVLLAVGLAFHQLLRLRVPAAPVLTGPGGALRSAIQRAEPARFLFTALTLGGLAFLNTWDFPILLGICVLARAISRWQQPTADGSPARGRLAVEMILYALSLGAASAALYIFFYLGFASQAGGVLPYIFPPTRLPQYLVMFGPFIFILTVFTALAARDALARQAKPLRDVLRVWLWLAGAILFVFMLALLAGLLVLPNLPDAGFVRAWLGDMSLSQTLLRILQVKAANPWLFLLLSALAALALSALWYGLNKPAPAEPHPNADPRAAGQSAAGQFALLLALAGIGLTLAVEFFYLRDNFGMRMNTIFKFYIQGWVLMACASAYGLFWIMRRSSGVARAVFASAAALLVAAGMVYPVMAVISRTEGFSRTPTLDAAATFAGFYPGHWAAQPDDYAAAQWLAANGRLPGGSPPLILEAGARGYENAGRISAFTGFPSLLGWSGHEGQWRGTQEQISRREPVIAAIYTTSSPQTALELLQTWNVHFVILGNTERQFIDTICQNPDTTCRPDLAKSKFDRFLIPVFSQGSTTIYRVPLTPQP